MAAALHSLLVSGEALAIRKKSGLTLELVGRSVGAHGSTVGRWERCERQLPRGEPARRYFDLLVRLRRALP